MKDSNISTCLLFFFFFFLYKSISIVVEVRFKNLRKKHSPLNNLEMFSFVGGKKKKKSEDEFHSTKGNSYFSVVQFSSSVVPNLCDPMDCSMPGLPVHHQLSEPTQTHVHWIGDTIQQSHPLSPSPPTFNLSQHQDLSKWVSSSHQVTELLEFCFNISPSNEYSGLIPLGWTGWVSLQFKGLSRVFSNTIIQKHQFFCAQLSL